MINFTLDTKQTGDDLDIGRFSLGQGGLGPGPDIAFHTQELRNLNLKIIRLFIQEYYDLYPKKGAYNWTLLDRSVEAIIATGAKPLMCITFKPKTIFPEIDPNIVEPKDYQEWEQLVYELVRHYNEEKKYGIEYWEVGNEPDFGERGGCPFLFTPENYPRFYEHTVQAIKRADPKAKVGGPALAHYDSSLLSPFLKYCAANKTPLDFVSWHVYSRDPKTFGQQILFVRELLDEYNLKCETSINEWNLNFSNVLKYADLPEYQPCFVVDVVNTMIEQGLSHCCYYHIRNVNVVKETFGFLSTPSKSSYGVNFGFSMLGMFDSQGVARPVYFAFKLLSRLLGKRIKIINAGENVKILAAYDKESRMATALIWNFAVDEPKEETINLSILAAEEGDWCYTRHVLDAKILSNAEEHRLKLVTREVYQGVSQANETFILDPYGVTQITFKW